MFRFPPLTPFVKRALIVFAAAFVLELALIHGAGLRGLELLLALNPSFGLSTLWQLFTHPFIQLDGRPGLTSLVLSSLFFWWIVSPFELQYGVKRTAQLVVASLFGAAIAALLVGSLLGGAPLFGFHAATLGVIAAFAWSIRHRSSLSLFGAIEMKPQHVLILLVGWSGLQLYASGNVAGFAADLGAIGTGMLFIEQASRAAVRKRRPRKRKDSGARRRRNGLRVIEGEGQGGSDEPPKWLN